jgi:plastocyanin domain-containing protein
MKKYQVVSILVSIGLSFGIVSSVLAEETSKHNSSAERFQPIEQPTALKIAISLGGLSLMVAQLWWFLGSRPKSQQAEINKGVQEVTITVDGGYVPSMVTVKRGQPVRLQFDRRDPSSCLEKVLFPDFHVAQDLVLNQTTPVEFTPQTVGMFQFSCGMGMFHGAIAVED